MRGVDCRLSSSCESAPIEVSAGGERSRLLFRDFNKGRRALRYIAGLQSLFARAIAAGKKCRDKKRPFHSSNRQSAARSCTILLIWNILRNYNTARARPPLSYCRDVLEWDYFSFIDSTGIRSEEIQHCVSFISEILIQVL